MFPDRVRAAAGATFHLSLSVAQKMYRFSRAALWIGTTSFMILVLPVVFETEKLQMEQQQQLQQRQGPTQDCPEECQGLCLHFLERFNFSEAALDPTIQLNIQK
ncbi:mitochondrial import receptor subunit TOM22-like protein [Alligator mississippiensis]|uniref:Mitochondrial import receptor subunit TOM22 homolog n=1 Tax=Alligator mississippiensis TaxID=8496 RepID=A0A151NHU2_ALLMI|nr:mitochondrial import receptor subunit TOM22-like protein [Alligator mississippiensis]